MSGNTGSPDLSICYTDPPEQKQEDRFLMEYSIGDFSRICRLGVKTLRYYHEIELLVPTRIDRFTGYRYYSKDLLPIVRMLQRLKSYHFSLDEIREILETNPSDDDLERIVLKKIEGLEQQIDGLQTARDRLKGFLKSQQAQPPASAAGSINEVITVDQNILSHRFQGRYDEIGEWLGKLYDAAGSRVNGRPFSLYYDNQSIEQDADIEICLPVNSLFESTAFPARFLPGGRALSILHTGPYENLSLSYQKIVDFLYEQNLSYRLPVREVYLKGPGLLSEGDVNQYLTEILFMLV